MATVESLVSAAFNPKEWEVRSPSDESLDNSDSASADTNTQRILAEESGKSVAAAFVDGIEIEGKVFQLMTLSAHRTKRYNQICAVLSNEEGKQIDVNLKAGEIFTAESLKPHILTALRATSIVEVFKAPVQVGEHYFRLSQLAQLSDTAVVFIAQCVDLGQVTVTLPPAAEYTREDISKHITEELAKSSSK